MPWNWFKLSTKKHKLLKLQLITAKTWCHFRQKLKIVSKIKECRSKLWLKWLFIFTLNVMNKKLSKHYEIQAKSVRYFRDCRSFDLRQKSSLPRNIPSFLAIQGLANPSPPFFEEWVMGKILQLPFYFRSFWNWEVLGVQKSFKKRGYLDSTRGCERGAKFFGVKHCRMSPEIAAVRRFFEKRYLLLLQ